MYVGDCWLVFYSLRSCCGVSCVLGRCVRYGRRDNKIRGCEKRVVMIFGTRLCLLWPYVSKFVQWECLNDCLKSSCFAPFNFFLGKVSKLYRPPTLEGRVYCVWFSWLSPENLFRLPISISQARRSLLPLPLNIITISFVKPLKVLESALSTFQL